MGQLYSPDWHVMLILSQVTVAVNACSRGSQPGRGRQPPSENSPALFFPRDVGGFKFHTDAERISLSG